MDGTTEVFQNPRAEVKLGKWQLLASTRLVPGPSNHGLGVFPGLGYVLGAARHLSSGGSDLGNLRGLSVVSCLASDLEAHAQTTSNKEGLVMLS